MRRCPVFGIITSLVTALGGGQAKSGEFWQAVGTETAINEGSIPVGNWLSGTSRSDMPANAATSARSPRVDSPVRRTR